MERSISIVEKVEEASALLVHVELQDFASDSMLEEWREQILSASTGAFAETFGLRFEDVELEVDLYQGSLWVKIKPKLRTVLLILNLYNAGHKAAETGPHDWEMLKARIEYVVTQTTGGQAHVVDDASAHPPRR
jgi:hypothetical protein